MELYDSLIRFLKINDSLSLCMIAGMDCDDCNGCLFHNESNKIKLIKILEGIKNDEIGRSLILEKVVRNVV
jgi:hypothetical protein